MPKDINKTKKPRQILIGKQISELRNLKLF